jgi:hypothetical protein
MNFFIINEVFAFEKQSLAILIEIAKEFDDDFASQRTTFVKGKTKFLLKERIRNT